ncbi:MAG TPA: cation transporter [Gemmatimonadaceae bacterium]|nr:cation transporter [Gemmatimonadaceae bacterium]
MEQTSLSIDGMSCGHCIAHVRKALAALPGVHVDDVAVGSATIHYDAGAATPEDIAKAVTSAGYAVRAQRTVAAPGA